ncbi:MAG: hypothetical protein RSA10_02850 [Bacilli bacterium]
MNEILCLTEDQLPGKRDLLGCGNYGACFEYEKNVLKLVDINDVLTIDILSKIERNVDKLSNVVIKGVSFPLQKLYVDDFFKGYTMPYLNGIKYSDVLSNIIYGMDDLTLYEAILAYESGVSKIEKISNQKILMGDMLLKNIMYHNNDLQFYDTDFYEIREDYKTDEILLLNLKNFNFLMNRFMFNINKTLLTKEELNKLKAKTSELKENYMEILLQAFVKKSNHKVKTLGDLVIHK